ncbi:hypothetical protein GRI69_15455 [Erythrobacter vulgaris]|uniref:Lipoprotein n=1 Tax=Qipengyuania vulgaris TaxID=291985 RepID=A0A844XWR6_9SPHN|nr:hypothetical protein [Qipengyuania vulgaris]MXO49647.1 hypothetical protein [Qipengyuania vulgaris]
MKSWAMLLMAAGISACSVPAKNTGASNHVEARLVELPGCCFFRTTAEVRAGDGSVPVEGFSPTVIRSENEHVTIFPLLGYYGWLDAEGGESLRIGDEKGLFVPTANGKKAVLALERVSNQGMPLSIVIATDCSASCEVFDQVIRTFETEQQWRVRVP